jgi:hypothetical protein
MNYIDQLTAQVAADARRMLLIHSKIVVFVKHADAVPRDPWQLAKCSGKR